jgi:sugar phosphate isomerase/epimerase
MFMTFDLNHANLNEDPVAVCADCAGLVKHIHISDNHGFREEHLIPGTGTMDLAAIMKGLYLNGYEGPWNLEFGFPKEEIPTQEKYRSIHRFMLSLLDSVSEK